MSKTREDQMSDSSDEDIAENINGWDDIEDDSVTESFVSLFDQKVFDNLDAMLKYSKDEYDFDIWTLQQDYDLDFLGLIKLINYVRKSVSVGSQKPDLSSSSVFSDDMFLLPVMESDAVLYNLEEVLTQARPASKTREEELEEELSALKDTFKAYKEDVTSYLGDKVDNLVISKEQQLNGIEAISSGRPDDDGYFQSYSFNAIHETMLKDKIRTDAYRDFIYEHKDVFKDKVVLDVGCGTGILSMFCAKAGAKQVIAVDNSDIISTAREIIRTNELDDRIQCIKGKIEEINLSVDHVDIIVSEWMGYGLLFESMLDSVIFARDKYLAPEGLMVPSHATVRTGILADSEIRETCLNFWQDVYGFDMIAMASRTQDECIIRVSSPEDISGEPTTIQVFDLHHVTVSDLDFHGEFVMKAGTGAQRFDGFSVWFDIFFSTQRELASDALNLEKAKADKMVAFTTGPFGQATHWAQGICLIDSSISITSGSTISGNVTFAKGQADVRSLTISIDSKINGSETVKQVWYIK